MSTLNEIFGEVKPKSKNSSSKMTILFGKNGSGKTTLASTCSEIGETLLINFENRVACINESDTLRILPRLIDGWYHTGDLGIIDAEGNVFIKGRSKNMLLGANGQNIYPEEIEDKLNSLPMVAECVVIQKGEKLYALIYPDMEQVKALKLGEDEIKVIMEQNRKDLNTQIPAYEQICGVKIMEQEFEKTPKRSIKRFLYKDEEI